MTLTVGQLDRAAGVLAGQAAGDALGAHYEGGRPDPDLQPRMLGGGYGPYDPGEWTDDTQMAICIGQVARTGAPLHTVAALDQVAMNFSNWLHGGATDVGFGVRAVLTAAADRPGRASDVMLEVSGEHAQGGQNAGNGALMRTSIVGLTRLYDRNATAAAAAAVAALTHADQRCIDSAVLWSEAVRVAVVHGRLDLRSGLGLLPDPSSRQFWADAITVAEQPDRQAEYRNNGYTVSALQAAWHAVKTTEKAANGPAHVISGLKAAVRLGGDTDTVAAIAGGLLGARHGIYAIRTDWMNDLHGWPGMTAVDLVDIAQMTALHGVDTDEGGTA